jgi:two-component SAPR family response regulator
MAYSINGNSFKKIYDFKPMSEDVCFSNSMVIDPIARTYYALSFSVIKYDGQLQLVKGFLDKPEQKTVSDNIPFLFHDIKSFSTLYHCKTSKKLIAATMLLNDQEQTECNLYSISFPPNETEEVVQASKNLDFIWIYLAIIVIVLVPLYFYFRKHFKTRKMLSPPLKNISKISSIEFKNESDISDIEQFKNSIFFFGGLQVFNSGGKDVTHRFSPLLKELFLLIWLNSSKNNKGISSEIMTELLWFDKDEKSASNNRAVNIAKLKQIISELDTCTLSHKSSYWKIEFDESAVHNDYTECLKLAGSKKAVTKERIAKIISLTNKGPFLLNSTYEWLDEFKADLSNRMIDILVDFALTQKIEEDPDFILSLADAIFNFDVVNEEAMILKCKALTFLGKHSLASNVFTKFARDYKSLYGEYYTKSVNEVVNFNLDKFAK